MKFSGKIVAATLVGSGVVLSLFFFLGIFRDPTFPRGLGKPLTVIDVNWDGDPHLVDAKTAVGVANAPDTVRFGSPFVRTSVGALNGRVLEFDPSQNEVLPKGNFFYEQVEFLVAKKAEAYRVTCDLTIAPRNPTLRRDSLTLFFDGRTTTKLVFGPTGMIRFFDYPFIETDVMEYPIDEVIHLKVLLDFSKWKLVGEVNGKTFEFPLKEVECDLRDFRVNFSDPTDQYGRAALDNLKISAYGTKSIFRARTRGTAVANFESSQEDMR